MECLLKVTRASWGAHGLLWAPIRRLASAWVAPVASERSSGATFGRERPREWCPQRPSDSPNVSIFTIKPMIFEGRLFAEIGVQGPPWAPGRRFKDPQGSPRGPPQGDPRSPQGASWGPFSRAVPSVNAILRPLFPLFDFAKIQPAP